MDSQRCRLLQSLMSQNPQIAASVTQMESYPAALSLHSPPAHRHLVMVGMSHIFAATCDTTMLAITEFEHSIDTLINQTLDQSLSCN